MTVYLNRIMVLVLIITSPAVFAQGSKQPAIPKEKEDTINKLVAEESVKRQEIYDKAKALIEDGKALAGQKKYEDANALFLQAETTLDAIAGDCVDLKEKQLQAYIASFRIKWAKAIENAAYKDFANKDYDATIMKINEAQQIKGLPKPLKVELQNFVDLCRKRIESADFTRKTSLEYKNVDPDNSIRKYEIDVALSKAKTLLNNKQYARARDSFERILVRDPYNFEAAEALKNLYKTLREVGLQRQQSDLLERVSEVQWKWSDAVLPLPTKRPDSEETVEATTGKSALSEKLSTIIIKNINFTDVNIQTVVKYLAEESKRLDSEGIGINIALGIDEAELASVPTVTMNLKDIPLGEVIRYLCQSCNLKYRVDDRVLTIGTDAINPMNTRFFKVRSALITRIVPTEGSADGGGGSGEDDKWGEDDMFDSATTFDDAETEGVSTKRAVTTEALKTYFTERGVPFPEGSTIAYDRRAGKLVVKNTHENLRRLETLLRALDLEQPQVLIEAKFVEIRQVDLEEMGFEWWIRNSPEHAGSIKLNDPSPPNAPPFPPNSSLVRPLGTNWDNVDSPVDPGATYRLLNNVAWPVFNSGSWNFRLNMMLHAVDQHQNTEILSAPKVIAKSGDEATIRMVREEYYPESWTEPELALVNDRFAYTPSHPEFGDPTDVGIKFIVTPTVSPNNYTITLALNPQVIQRVGWSEYFIDYAYPSGASGQISGHSTVLMPQISRRDANTNVRVYDGDTIVLGGMLTENSSGNDDRVPAAGNVPLAGILGRVQVESNNKTNLLIFVTARIVNPDGLPVRISPNNGLFDFRR